MSSGSIGGCVTENRYVVYFRGSGVWFVGFVSGFTSFVTSVVCFRSNIEER